MWTIALRREAIQVVNGHGEVTITSQPEKSTTLKVNTIKCETIYILLLRNIFLLTE